ncbi:MAG: rhodanese-like domain-containing protein [Ferruginibacter sp.]|nr:rhodanese-like domain-containing protein [Ferruginibacter sp.]
MKVVLKNIIFVAIVFLFASCNESSNANKTAVENKDQVKEISYKNSFLVDVRTPEEFAEGSVTGAVNIPLADIETSLEEFKNKSQIVVFCRSGSRSSMAKTILDKNNIANVINGGTWLDVKNKLAK